MPSDDVPLAITAASRAIAGPAFLRFDAIDFLHHLTVTGMNFRLKGGFL